MAAVAPIVYNTPLPSVSENRMQTSPSKRGNGSNLHQSNVSQGLSKPSYTNALVNWHNYNVNNNVDATFNAVKSMPSPPSTPSSSTRSSTNSSPPTSSRKQSDNMPPPAYFNSYRPRSKSMAMPAPTSCCSNCGLRRPSTSSDQPFTPSPENIEALTKPRPHLPLHLHCPDPCPDTILPAKGSPSPTSPYFKQRHHRRRSSLCYAESLVDDAGTMDGGSLPADIKQTWEKQAENIARKVMLRRPSPDTALALENAIEED